MSNEAQSLSVGVGESTPWYRQSEQWFVGVAGRAKGVVVYSTLYLVVVAMLEAVLVSLALGLSLSLGVVVIGLVTFSVYAGDRLADVDADAVTKPGQAAFIRRHERVLSVLTAAAYGMAVMLAVTKGPAALTLTLLPGGFWVVYASEWLPRVGRVCRRAKDVLVVNSLLVGVAWAITLTFVPVVWTDASVSLAAGCIFVYVVVDRFINTEIPNFQDVAGDAAAGVATLPVAVGVQRTRGILYALSGVLIGLLVWAYVAGVFSLVMTAAFVVGVGYTVGVTAAIGRTDQYRRLAIASELKHVLVLAIFLTIAGPL